VSRPTEPDAPVDERTAAAADPEAWRIAGARLLARAIGELAYEGLLRPVPGAAPDAWSLALPAATYRFRATRDRFDGFVVDPGSVRREDDASADGPTRADDPALLLRDAAPELGLAGGALVDALRDLAATRAADVHLARRRPSAAALADLEHVALEAHGEGHPRMVLNKGRLGFGPSDLRRYAPEHAPDVRLAWIAAHPDLAAHHGLDAGAFAAAQLDEEERARFAARLREHAAGDPSDWAWLPVHPFHLERELLGLLAEELATGRVVVLGTGADRHRPLQSVRTLANVDRPDRHDVKLPLAIRNTLVWRGLSAEHSAQAPALSAWLARAIEADDLLAESGFVALAERAAVTLRPSLVRGIPELPYRYAETGGAVLRQPVHEILQPGERARSLAALTLVGRDGRALVTELVARSGLDAETWLARLLDALLPPLVRFLVRHGVAFCPHGENTVVVLDGRDVPVRVAVKDLAEDVNLVPERRPEHDDLPAAAAAVLLRWPVGELRHSLLSALVAGHFRTFAPLVADHLGVPERAFWALVAGTLQRCRDDGDRELAARFDELGLFAPRFERIQLNREQLSGDAFHERAERDEGFDLAEGTVPSPLADVDRDAAAVRVADLLGGASSGRAALAGARR
jgi:aerobactin synthase